MVFPSPRGQQFQRPIEHRQNPFMFPNRNVSPSRQGLPSLLGKFTNQQASAGLINKGVGGLSSTLNNVQQVLKVVQSTAPIVQEYGPMVKNLPSMYRMMKAFKDLEAEDKKSDDKPIESKDNKYEKEQVSKSQSSKHIKRETSGDSKPILFI
ncbi:VrrA/YqfQ family protein [Oceanobacillus manasiensis]|uniref:VrrA/YqfQ family protein n=1 Tax=Oceanobacillus manasiensis TaxID=586413 RepID=UPI0005A89969|nr:VrrA/YqfQ family protein [Oceanobacillus manasiensis]